MAITEISDFASYWQPIRGFHQAEGTSGRAGQNILGQANQQGTLKGCDSVFAKPWHMELDECTWSVIRRGKRLIAAWTDIPVQASLTVTHDGARGVSRGGGYRMVEPPSVTGGYQNLRVQAAESLCICILYLSRHYT
jgi:hypothetical protein